MLTATADFSRLKRANIAIERATGRAAADIVNRSLKNVAYRAAEYTPKADPVKIEASLRKDKLGLRIVTKRLKAAAGGVMVDWNGNTMLTKSGRARKQGRVTRKMIALRTRQLVARRKKVRGYLRAGWFPAIVALGGTIRGKGDLRAGVPLASLGSATPATQAKTFGQIVNRVYAKIGKGRKRSRAFGATQAAMESALLRAVAKVRRENEAYARKKTREAIRLGHKTG